MRVTLPAATAAQRAARQHTASFAARGTSCASPAVGSMVPRPRTATWMPAKKGAGKRRQHGSRLSSPEPGSSLCRCGSHRLCPGRPQTPLENVRPRGFHVAARWASHAAPTGRLSSRCHETRETRADLTPAQPGAFSACGGGAAGCSGPHLAPDTPRHTAPLRNPQRAKPEGNPTSLPLTGPHSVA